jgi:hypothetical protein
MKLKNMKGPITRFMDMHSGGHLKTPYTHIYIDEPIGEALRTFKELFKRNPDNITCKCCGEDFIYEEYSSIEEATAYDRGCGWDEYNNSYCPQSAKISVEDYFTKEKVLLITD